MSSLGGVRAPWWGLRWGGRSPGYMSNYTRMGWGCLLVLRCVCWRVSGADVVWVMAWSMAGVLAVAVPAPPRARLAPCAPRRPARAPRRAAPRRAAPPRAPPRARSVGPCRGWGAVWACAGRSRGGWGLVSDRGCVRAGGRVGAAGGGGLVRPGRRSGTVSAGPPLPSLALPSARCPAARQRPPCSAVRRAPNRRGTPPARGARPGPAPAGRSARRAVPGRPRSGPPCPVLRSLRPRYS